MGKILKIFDLDLAESRKRYLSQLELEAEIGWLNVSPGPTEQEIALRRACQILHKEMMDFYSDDEEEIEA